MRTTTQYTADFINFTNNTSSDNVTLGLKLVNDAMRYLVGIFFFNESTYTVPGGTVSNQAGYQLPFNNKQVINTTVLIGSVLYQPQEVSTRKAYDALNVIPFQNDYAQYYYIYNNQLLLWPAPASAGDPITINYKRRLRDLSAPDFTSGTVTVSNGSASVTGSAGNWTTNMAGRWLNIPQTTSNTTSGDDEWYQIASVTNGTTLILDNQYQGQSITSTAGGYTIGEVPILPEDFQDLPLYRACYIYYTFINSNTEKSDYFKALYDEGYARLEAEFGSKTASVGVTSQDMSIVNPNLFQTTISHA